MKKLLCALSLLLCVALIGSTTVFAADTGDEIYAVATTAEGEDIILADAPDALEIGDLESYELILGDEPALTVEQTDASAVRSGADNNGYFSADFTLPDTEKQVYLVGLSADKVAEIQNKIIENYAKGANFKLTDLSFIDAEKLRQTDDGDDYLCWAATASNLLTYTGWAAQAGFDTTDDVFESYIDAFTDNGGDTVLALGWFFNGVNTFEVKQPGVAASATAGTGGYLNDYSYGELAESVDVLTGGVDALSELHQSLRDGYGVGLGLTIYHMGSYSGGHAVTCWGYIADTAYDPTDPAYYAGLFLTDSDSDQMRDGDRRDAPNILQAVSLTTGEDANGVMTFELDLDAANHAIVDEFFRLTPYSADVVKETASDATRDKVNSPDLTNFGFYLGTDLTTQDYEYFDEKIESNTKFFYTPVIKDEADKTYSGRTRIVVTFTDADGNTAFTRTVNTNLSIRPDYYVSFGSSLINNNGLSEGDYTVTVTLNGDHAVSEAYYYNNTYSFPLKVRDSYLLGDFDGSGSVDIIDATGIQRMLAGYHVGDEKAAQRGTITGKKPGIMDATAIQRKLANYQVSYPIGEKKLYD